MKAVESTSHKIMARETARQWRNQQTGSVVFTNGVFDLVHPGHVDLLEQARALGDVLIVAINDDESARSLRKGRGRPVIDVASRMRVVAALAAADCVVSFPEPTPAALVAELQPDVLVKGADYTGRDVPGQETVRARGGRVVLIPIAAGHSSTAIVERIRATT